MNIFESIIFGVVEGVTEFLPISSTAHLDFTRILLGLPNSPFVKSFEITIQLGAILSVVYLYRKKIFTSFTYFKNISIAFIPTGLIGFVLYKVIKSFFLGNIWLEFIMLFLGGIFILFFEKLYKNKSGDSREISELKTKELLLMGSVQALAVMPGVSRSLTVIVSGRTLGLSKETVTEFSFLLAIPTMLAATVYDLYKSGFEFSNSDWRVLGLGFCIAFITALLSVKWLLNYIKHKSFNLFGWYRIIASMVILCFLLW